jgi:hypothetical protein
MAEREVVRDVTSGKFASEADAEANPAGTVHETVHVGPMERAGRVVIAAAEAAVARHPTGMPQPDVLELARWSQGLLSTAQRSLRVGLTVTARQELEWAAANILRALDALPPEEG